MLIKKLNKKLSKKNFHHWSLKKFQSEFKTKLIAVLINCGVNYLQLKGFFKIKFWYEVFEVFKLNLNLVDFESILKLIELKASNWNQVSEVINCVVNSAVWITGWFAIESLDHYIIGSFKRFWCNWILHLNNCAVWLLIVYPRIFMLNYTINLIW